MNIYKSLIESSNQISYYFNEYNKNSICFLDIETTGLSRKYNYIYLIGVVYYDEVQNSWCLKQFFANQVEKEKELMETFNNFITKFHLIITYNGNSFDLPFIKYRLNKYSINSSIDNIDSFDIYREIRSNSSYLNFENLKLKTIEEHLGIYREDEYSGKDCVDFYYQFINTGDNILKNRILKHNYDDLYYLLDILIIFDYIKELKTINIDYFDRKTKIELKNIIIDGNILSLVCKALIDDEEINIIYYEETFNINWQNQNLIINLEIREGLITPTKKCLFLNKVNWPDNIKLKDMSQYMVPNNIILLKVENKYEMENIKNLIKELINYILNKNDRP